MACVLIVDDEPAICESVAYALQRDGFVSLSAGSLVEAQRLWPQADLIVLDLMLPDGSGLDFLRQVRQVRQVPVVVLSSRDGETDRVVGLELGADDYVVKPFSPRELVARVRAVLRRAKPTPLSPEGPALGSQISGLAQGETPTHSETGFSPYNASAGSPAVESLTPGTAQTPAGGVRSPLRINPSTRRVHWTDKELELSRTEFDLLWTFSQAPGHVLSRARLVDQVWGPDCTVTLRTVDAHIKTLRKKLEQAGAVDEVIETVRGVGYRLALPSGPWPG